MKAEHVVSLTANQNLEHAITRGDLPAVKAALELGADANHVGAMGYPMVSWAVVSGAKIDVVELLEKGGADLEAAANDRSRSCLAELAVAFCRLDVVALLAERGVFEASAKARSGVALVDTACEAPETAKSKMSRMLTSLKLGSSVMQAMGPMEGAFSGLIPEPARGDPQVI